MVVRSLLLLLLIAAAVGGAAAWSTVQFGTGAANDVGYGVAIESGSSASMYVCGYTTGTFAGATNAGSYDAFVRKVDVATGSGQWAVMFGTTVVDYGRGVAVDAASANVFVTGYTAGALPTGGGSAGGRDMYVRKLSALTGAEHWTVQFGSVADDEGYSVAVDASSSVYVTGYTNGALPGQGTAGLNDAFVWKMSPSTGATLWTSQFGTGSNEYGYSVVVDATATNVYVAGYTGGVLGGTSVGANDGFVRRVSAATGAEVWTVQFGTTSNDYVHGVAVELTFVYATGYTGGTFAGASSSGGIYDGFVRKLSVLSGAEEWTVQFGTTNEDYARAIMLDAVSGDVASSVYVTGYTRGAFAGSESAGIYDVFARKLSAATGGEEWNVQFGTTGDDYGYGLVLDSWFANVYVSGSAGGAMPDAIASDTTGTGMFIRRFDASPSSSSALTTVEVAAIVIGCIIVLGCAVWCCIRQRSKRRLEDMFTTVHRTSSAAAPPRYEDIEMQSVSEVVAQKVVLKLTLLAPSVASNTEQFECIVHAVRESIAKYDNRSLRTLGLTGARTSSASTEGEGSETTSAALAQALLPLVAAGGTSKSALMACVDGSLRARLADVRVQTETDGREPKATKAVMRANKEERARAAKELVAKGRAEEEERRRAAKEEAVRVRAEEKERKRAAKEEAARLRAEEKERKRVAKEEAARARAEEKAREAERVRLAKEEEERKRAEEAERLRLIGEEEERKRAAEAERLRLIEEEEERKRAEEAERLRLIKEEEERKRAEEAERLAEIIRLEQEAERQRLAAEAEARRIAEEAERERVLAERKRKAIEQMRLAEEQRIAAEQERARLAEEKRLADEAMCASTAAAVANRCVRELIVLLPAMVPEAIADCKQSVTTAMMRMSIDDLNTLRVCKDGSLETERCARELAAHIATDMRGAVMVGDAGDELVQQVHTTVRLKVDEANATMRVANVDAERFARFAAAEAAEEERKAAEAKAEADAKAKREADIAAATERAAARAVARRAAEAERAAEVERAAEAERSRGQEQQSLGQAAARGAAKQGGKQLAKQLFSFF